MRKDHLENLLEDIRGKFDLVLEGHASLDKKIDLRFDQLNEKIEINSVKIDALHQKVDENSRKIDENGRKIDENSRKIDENGRKIDENSRKIEGNGRKIDTLDKKIDAVAADLRAHRRDTEAHPGKLKVKKG